MHGELLPRTAHWLPKPFWPPQSGHSQVMALQDIPHRFSSMQLWQIRKPQRQDQQKGKALRQQSQVVLRPRGRFMR
jgi:hypothetical protein